MSETIFSTHSITLVLTTNPQQATEDKNNPKPKRSSSSLPLITAYMSAHIIGHKCNMQSSCDNLLSSVITVQMLATGREEVPHIANLLSSSQFIKTLSSDRQNDFVWR